MRLFVGFLFAPAVVTIFLGTSMDVVLSHLGANPDGPARIMIGAFILNLGVVIPYLGGLCFGLPYVLILRARRQLTFRAVMIPTLVLSLIYPVIVYLSLCWVRRPHPLAEAVAAPQVLGVILSGLFFYFVGVWKPDVGQS